MTISKLVIDGDSKNCLKNPFLTTRSWRCYRTSTLLSYLSLFPVIPHYGGMARYSLPCSQPAQSLSGKAQPAWLSNRAVLLLSLRPGQRFFFPSPLNSVSRLSLHISGCDLLDPLSALGVLESPISTSLPLELWENALLLNHAQEAWRYCH